MPVARMLSRRIAWALAALLVGVGCAPTSKRLRREIERDGAGTYLAGVPFVRQRRNWCGPAALASVARYYGLDVTQQQVAREVYLPSIGGSLTIDLARCARGLGLWCHSASGTPDDVRSWLDRGVPVVALLKVGTLTGTAHHYVVVLGYHRERHYLLAHTGHLSSRPIGYERFARQFAAAGGWFLAACPPERVTWPLSAQGHSDLGVVLERAGQLERAKAEYERAIAAQADQPVFHFNLGNVLAALGDAAAAERAYREAIRQRPEFADAHNNLACLLLDRGQRHQALHAARRAVTIDGPRVAAYCDTVGRCFLALGRHDEAADAFRRAVAEARDDAVAAGARLGLIEALLRAGHRTEAAAEKRRLLASTSDPALRQRADHLLE